MVTAATASPRGHAVAAAGLPPRSAMLVRWFRGYSRRYVARHFHALRLARDAYPPRFAAGPLLVVMNHPSWWDPLIALLLAELMPGRAAYAPSEARMLARYPMLERIGLFPVDRTAAAGVRGFLRVSRSILADDSAALWITGQGEFVDPRCRPVRLLPGIGYLAQRAGWGTVLPVALEYPFWDERTPEVLARFGRPIDLARTATAKQWTDRIASALTDTQDALMRQSQARDPDAFVTLVSGRAGVGGPYDLWRRARAAWRGEPFQAEHRPETRP